MTLPGPSRHPHLAPWLPDAITPLNGGAASLAPPLDRLHRVSLTPWILYSLAAMICAGAFAAAQKLASNHVSAEISYLAQCGAGVILSGRTRWPDQRHP